MSVHKKEILIGMGMGVGLTLGYLYFIHGGSWPAVAAPVPTSTPSRRPSVPPPGARPTTAPTVVRREAAPSPVPVDQTAGTSPDRAIQVEQMKKITFKSGEIKFLALKPVAGKIVAVDLHLDGLVPDGFRGEIYSPDQLNQFDLWRRQKGERIVPKGFLNKKGSNDLVYDGVNGKDQDPKKTYPGLPSNAWLLVVTNGTGGVVTGSYLTSSH